MIDIERTIVSQYGNSATITQLVRNMNEYVDPRADIDAFYSFVWNVDTARGFGLDILGRIVGISRDLRIPQELSYFGFSEELAATPFDEAPFYDGTPPATQTYRLADDPYRKLILIKALANISTPTMRALNQLLRNVFEGRGRCYANEQGAMQIRYTFEFLLTPYELAIMTQSGAMPRPAGVSAILVSLVLPAFGFSEAGADSAAPFGQATFISEGATYAAN
jgi:hypothetical protein